MPIVAVALGAETTGVGGDSNRTAFGKVNTSISELDAREAVDGVDGADGEGVPAGGTVGQALTKINATNYNTEWTTLPAAAIEAVAGGAGFVNASGAVALDLANARAFHRTMIGSITALTFTNVPNEDAFSAVWTLVLRVDATGGYALSGTPTVTWAGGSTWADLDLDANAENIVTFWRVGTTTFATLVWNGALGLDPYALSFPTNGAQLVVVTRAETFDLGDVTNVEADGTAGTGTLSYKRNGTTVTGAQAFAAGQVLEVTMADSTTASAVSIPRSLPLNRVVYAVTGTLTLTGAVPIVAAV